MSARTVMELCLEFAQLAAERDTLDARIGEASVDPADDTVSLWSALERVLARQGEVIEALITSSVVNTGELRAKAQLLDSLLQASTMQEGEQALRLARSLVYDITLLLT